MGAFFTNLQVLGGAEPVATRARLIQAITRWLRDRGMTEAGKARSRTVPF